MLFFEWDNRKDQRNRTKHGVSFPEAQTVFSDHRSLTIFDPDHSRDESRFLTLGLSARGRLLCVSHTDRGEAVRIISARKASRHETAQYNQANLGEA